MQHFKNAVGVGLVGLGLCVLALLGRSTVWGVEPPRAAKIFPAKTAALLSVPSVPDLRTAFHNSSSGQMFADPQIRPFLSDLWSNLVEAAAVVEKETGVSLDVIVQIPQGEFSVGWVSAEGQSWVILVLLDAGENVENLKKLIERGKQAAVKAGAVAREEDLDGIPFTMLRSPEAAATANEEKEEKVENGEEKPPAPTVGWAFYESTFVVGVAIFNPSDLDLVRDTVRRLKPGSTAASTDTLASQSKFSQFLDSIRYAQRGKIHGLFFADPIAIMKGYAAANTGFAITLAILPVLGLDGLNSVGAAGSLDVAGWDSVEEIHVFIDNPRRGVLDVPALKAVELNPEPVVPASAAAYFSLAADWPTTFSRVAKIYDGFRGEGAFQRNVADKSVQLMGIHLTQELLPAMAGRVSLIRCVEKPIRFNSIGTGFCIELKDAETATSFLDRITKADKAGVEQKDFGKRQYYQSSRKPPEPIPAEFRYPIPCLAAVDQFLIFTDGPQTMEELLATADDPTRGLAESLEFKLVRGRIKELAGKDSPCLIMYQRPDENMRVMYESLINRPISDRMRQAAEHQPVLKAFIAARDRNALPPFEVLQRYYAPQGGLLLDDAGGFHFITFGLRKKLP